MKQCSLGTIMRGVERKAFMARRLCGGADCSPHGSWGTEREVEKDRETETYRREKERQRDRTGRGQGTRQSL